MITTEEAVIKFKRVHGERYDYSKVVYSGAHVKVTIGCRDHGYFDQIPNSHLRGSGCRKCAIEARSDNRRSSLEGFITKAKIKHKDKFDYSKVNYINNLTKVIVICPMHGEFEVAPNNHLVGKDCNKCANLVRDAAKRSNTSEFLEKLKKVFDNKYDYSKVVYGRNNEEKVEIICKLHGSFFSKPANLLQGK